MGLLDFLRTLGVFRVKKNKRLDLLKPKNCADIIDDTVLEEINKIKWIEFSTAYGNAEGTVPYYLRNIFCADESIALGATHQLWCSICHQGVNMTDAALPAYEILKKGLTKLGDNVKAEVLDIFVALALCTSEEYFTVPNELIGWEKEIQQKLLRDKRFFHSFEKNDNENISDTAKIICKYLEKPKI